MQFTLVSLSFFAALAAAQTNSSTSLPGLVAQLPRCAMTCFQTTSTTIGCSPTNFTCLCEQSKRQQFITSIGSCLLFGTGGCSSDETRQLTTLAGQICTEVADNPTPSEIASASNVVTAALGSATAARTSSNLASMPTAAIGMMGAAALAAFAL